MQRHRMPYLAFFVAVLVLAVPCQSFAQGGSLEVCKYRTDVLSMNGIFTKIAGAAAGRDAVRAAVEESVDGAEAFRYAALYNPTEWGGAGDLVESIKQALGSDSRASLARILRWLAGAEAIPADLQDIVYPRLAAAIVPTGSPTVERFRANIEGRFAEGRRVFLVPHSQGNYFANEMYEAFAGTIRQHTGILSIANPDTHVADGRGIYTTGSEDGVIGSVRLIKRSLGLPEPLLANVSNGERYDDPAHGHSLTGYYFYPLSETLHEIKSGLFSLTDSVWCPPLDPVTYAFSGRVAAVGSRGTGTSTWQTLLGIEIPIGSTFTGRFTYSPEAARTTFIPRNPSFEEHIYFGDALRDLEITVAGRTFRMSTAPCPPAGGISCSTNSVRNGTGTFGVPAAALELFAVAGHGGFDGNASLANAQVLLQAPAMTASVPPILPLELPSLSTFSVQRLLVVGAFPGPGQEGPFFNGVVDSLVRQ
jgi:hypothetical protein